MLADPSLQSMPGAVKPALEGQGGKRAREGMGRQATACRELDVGSGLHGLNAVLENTALDATGTGRPLCVGWRSLTASSTNSCQAARMSHSNQRSVAYTHQ